MFGRYEGCFGLVLDNIIEMDVILADGSMITVSEFSHADLYRTCEAPAINSASSLAFKHKIYGIPYPKWYVATLLFTNDMLEAFFEQMNIFGASGTQPREAVIHSFHTLNREISDLKVGTPDCLL